MSERCAQAQGASGPHPAFSGHYGRRELRAIARLTRALRIGGAHSFNVVTGEVCITRSSSGTQNQVPPSQAQQEQAAAGQDVSAPRRKSAAARLRRKARSDERAEKHRASKAHRQQMQQQQHAAAASHEEAAASVATHVAACIASDAFASRNAQTYPLLVQIRRAAAAAIAQQ